MIEKHGIDEGFDRIREYWKPLVAATVNDTAVKLAKIRGEIRVAPPRRRR